MASFFVNRNVSFLKNIQINTKQKFAEAVSVKKNMQIILKPNRVFSFILLKNMQINIKQIFTEVVLVKKAYKLFLNQLNIRKPLNGNRII